MQLTPFDPKLTPPKKTSWENIQEKQTPIDLDDNPATWIAAGLVLLITTILVSLLIRWIVLAVRRRLRSPERRARKRLASKKLHNLDQKSLFDELHSTMAEYLAARTAIPAKSQTSGELLQRLPNIPELADFLTAADRARFSGRPLESESSPSVRIDQCRAILKAVRKQVRKRRKAAKVRRAN